MHSESMVIHNEQELKELVSELRSYDHDFDPDTCGREFPFIFEYVKGESNGYPDITYEIRASVDVKTKRIISILEQSDIVWGKYGADTIEELAKRIAKSTQD